MEYEVRSMKYEIRRAKLTYSLLLTPDFLNKERQCKF